MSLYESIVRPLAFNFDPERVHEVAMALIEKGTFRAKPFHDARLEQTLFGVRFPNPLGLAAGFDKNARALDYWHLLGFGHVECGTVTYRAQPGNPRPRLFRLPQDRALINRLGFNNDGARAVAGRLASASAQIPVGINLGKSKLTELDDAAKDYQESFRLMHRFGDYFVVNVSSPNTPGLRTLQEKGPLLEILSAMKEVDRSKPLFVKVAPDLETSALDEVVEVVHQAGLTGLIATNTTVGRQGLRNDPGQEGGLSGVPLREKSNAFLSHLYKSCNREMVLIGVGGIFNGADVYLKIRLGAHLCQLYTGWIYGGPHMVPEALAQLVRLLEADGYASLAEARGTL
ncbi:MAG TPA: quinone-dependent dihydroorotate dehydrogenase [Fimbriimonas sp.]